MVIVGTDDVFAVPANSVVLTERTSRTGRRRTRVMFPYPSFESVKALKSINTGKMVLRRHNNRQLRIRTQFNTKPL
ncbi:MAG: hypothetical protein WB474_01305 [Nitrososphaeraceae archaeon]